MKYIIRHFSQLCKEKFCLTKKHPHGVFEFLIGAADCNSQHFVLGPFHSALLRPEPNQLC